MMVNFELQLMVARDIQRERRQRAEPYRLARTARALRPPRRSRATCQPGIDAWSGQLERSC